MGVDQYLVVVDDKEKKVLIVYVGRGYNSEITKHEIDVIERSIEEIDRELEGEVINVEDERISNLRIGSLTGLVLIKKLLENIKYSCIRDDADLDAIITLYGLVRKLTYYGEHNWMIVDDVKIKDVVKAYEQRGYSVVWW